MHKFLSLFIASIVSFFLGLYICILIKKLTLFTLDPKITFQINPFELFSLMITGFLAIYVARTLSKRNDLEKNEKELIISNLIVFKSELKEKINSLLKQEIFTTSTTNGSFKLIRRQLDSIISLADEYKFIKKTDKYAAHLTNKVTTLWELFTDTPKKASSKSSVAIKQDIEILRLEKVGKIEFTIIEIEALLFQLTMSINRK